jgi:hypothetical protein
MNSEFEVAVWLANHPRILNLALEIKNAKSMPITNKESPQGLQDLQVLQQDPQVITHVMLAIH